MNLDSTALVAHWPFSASSGTQQSSSSSSFQKPCPLESRGGRVRGLRRGADGSRLVWERRYSAPSVVAEHRVSCRSCTRCARRVCLSVLTGGQGWLMSETRACEAEIAVLGQHEDLPVVVRVERPGVAGHLTGVAHHGVDVLR